MDELRDILLDLLCVAAVVAVVVAYALAIPHLPDWLVCGKFCAL